MKNKRVKRRLAARSPSPPPSIRKKKLILSDKERRQLQRLNKSTLQTLSELAGEDVNPTQTKNEIAHYLSRNAKIGALVLSIGSIGAIGTYYATKRPENKTTLNNKRKRLPAKEYFEPSAIKQKLGVIPYKRAEIAEKKAELLAEHYDPLIRISAVIRNDGNFTDEIQKHYQDSNDDLDYKLLANDLKYIKQQLNLQPYEKMYTNLLSKNNKKKMAFHLLQRKRKEGHGYEDLAVIYGEVEDIKSYYSNKGIDDINLSTLNLLNIAGDKASADQDYRQHLYYIPSQNLYILVYCAEDADRAYQLSCIKMAEKYKVDTSSKIVRVPRIFRNASGCLVINFF